MGTAVVAGIIAGITALIILSMIKDKKKGKHLCGRDCAKCRGCH